MINLLKKDLRVTFTKLNIGIIAFLFIFMGYIFIDSNDNSQNIAVISFIIASVFTSTSFAYEEKSNTDLIINSLPVTRTDIVKAKYVGILFFTVLALMFTLLLTTVANLTGLMINDIYKIDLVSLLLVCVLTIILNCILYPIFFKMGYRKAKIIWIIIYMLFFTIINLSVGLQCKISEFVSNNSIQIYGITALIVFIIYILSYKISYKLYNYKDL
ncbi:ABC-2 transporter permease [Abyssisolibacter fermentans]|uniref:ABC-2 transporter permease n=1 Tax=Abyssisolibacter fermentans TaxID=1766203 RepID=UPI00082FA966|nr:ABC-2 transporter permease [Abyssisolibacter fermentans]